MSPVDFARGRVSPLWVWLSGRIWSVEHAFEHARAQRREPDAAYRIFFVLMLFATAFAMLAAAAVTKVVWPAGRSSAAPAAIGQRADLVDRNGRLLAVDLLHYGAYLRPEEVWDQAEARRVLTAAIPGLSADRLNRAFATGKRVYLVGGLTPEQKQKLHDLGLPGLEFEEEGRRVYPLGSTAAHLIGFTDTGGKGLAGAERALDKLARQDAGEGGPVALSIDLRVQAALDEEVARAAQTFQTIGAVGIVVDVRTGEILGLSSWPNFDPNEPGKTPAPNMVDHAAATVYEPGSVFKVFTLAMGLDAGVATPKTMFDARTPLAMSGRTIHDYDKDNAMLPLWEVFTHSSNIGAARLGLLAGAERMQHYFRGFGLFAAAPSELAESARPIAPRQLNEGTVASMSFGHAISVSPLAIATGMTAVLNGGEYRPLTIRKLDGAPAPSRRVISETTSRTMLDLMRLNAIKGSGGTGGKADAAAPLLRVGGKTGSAEKAIGGHYERKKLVSSFAAVFPTDGPMNAPRYFVLIMLDEPHATKDTYGFATGGWTAAPTAGRVIDRIAPFLGVARASQARVDEENATLLARYVGAGAAPKSAKPAAAGADEEPAGDEE
jgi:cell division protein FtsI (penicillin-binding protein 3)